MNQINGRKSLKYIVAAGLVFGILFSPLFEKKVPAKGVETKVLSVSDYVDADAVFRYGDDEDELFLSAILKASVPIETAEPNPDKVRYNKYSYEEYERVSKKLFGRVIALELPKKPKTEEDRYYNPKKKIIFEPVIYDPGDVLVMRFHKTIKKLSKEKYLVTGYDTGVHPMSVDKRATKKTEIIFRKKGKKYVIKDIEVEDLRKTEMKLGKKDILKHLRNIKKWYDKPEKNDRKRSFKDGEDALITLHHNYNLVFAYKSNGKEAMRFYYKYGVPVRMVKTKVKTGKILEEYDLYYKGDKVFVNGKAVENIEDEFEIHNMLGTASFVFETNQNEWKK